MHGKALLERQNNIKTLLAQIKADFLCGLSARCYELENLVMALTNTDRESEQFHELYRIVHSLKGAGGTHGLPLITTICHHFEDLLQSEVPVQSEAFTDQALQLIDILHEVSKIQADNEALALQLLTDKFHNSQRTISDKQPVVLILETSRTVILLLQAMLSEYGIKAICMTESQFAFQRMLSEHFDMIILSQETAMLSGTAIIHAIQTNQGLNKDTPFILLTSNKDLNSKELKNTQIVDRSHAFATSLNPVISRLLETTQSTKAQSLYDQ